MLLPGGRGRRGADALFFAVRRVSVEWERFFSPLPRVDVTSREGRMGMLTQRPLLHQLARCRAVVGASHFPCLWGCGTGEGFAAWCGAVLSLLCPPGTDPGPG